MSATRVSRTARFTIRRVEGDRALVEGIAYLALDPQPGVAIPRAEAELRIDSWDTYMRRDSLETLAHRFLEYGRKADSAHDHGVVGDIVESYITREGDPVYPPDCWVAKVKVHDPAVIEQLDTGKLTGFSIEVLTRMQEVDVEIEGIGRMRVGEMIDPLPLFLSLVESPAIGVPFNAVTTVARAAPTAIVRVVRCVQPEETMEENEQQKARETALSSIRRAAGESLADDAVAKIIARSSRTDFAQAWTDLSPGIRAWSALWSATYLLQDTFYEIRYATEDSAEFAALTAKAAQDYAVVIAQLMSELTAAGTTEVEVRAVRAGKKISAARMEKIKAAHGRAGEAHATLAELISDVEGETDDDAAVEQKTAPGDGGASGMEKPTAPTTDPVAELRAKLEALEAKQVETDKALATARTEADAATKRAKELESMRPAGRSGEPESNARNATPAARDEKNWARGVLIRHADDIGDEAPEGE